MDVAVLRVELERRRDAFQRLGALVSGAALCAEVIEMLDGRSSMVEDSAKVPAAALTTRVPDGVDRHIAARERFWLGASEARLTVSELAEELGRPKSWIYRHTAAKAECRLPFRKLGGELIFVREEIRAWLKMMEVTVVAATARPVPPQPADRRISPKRTTTGSNSARLRGVL